MTTNCLLKSIVVRTIWADRPRRSGSLFTAVQLTSFSVGSIGPARRGATKSIYESSEMSRPLGEPDPQLPIIDLLKAPGERAAWDRPAFVVYVWAAVELLVMTNPWQISSRLRVRALRIFGADIGDDVVIRPRTRVKFPWKLHIGSRAWIGEGVWIHNQDHVYIGHDAVLSQETFLTTGSHDHRRDMALITKPIHIGPGAWITSRCMVTGGAVIGQSALIQPMSVVGPHEVGAGETWGGNPARHLAMRFGGPT